MAVAGELRVVKFYCMKNIGISDVKVAVMELFWVETEHCFPRGLPAHSAATVHH